MKSTLFAFLLLLTGVSVGAQSPGIVFEECDDWNALLDRAQQEEKIVFVSFYTDWSAACESMERYIFSAEEVGNFFNANFINIRLHAERGEGPKVVQAYEVYGVPSFLWVNGEGQLVYQEVGYLREHELLGHGKKALDPNRNLSRMRERYEEGDRDPIFLQQLARMLVDAGDPMGHAVIADYLDTQEDWHLQHNMEFIMLTLDDINTEEYDFVVRNFESFVDAFGEDIVFELLEKPLFDALYDPEVGSEVLRKADALYRRVLPEDAMNLSNLTRVYYYMVREDWQQYANETVKYVENNLEPIGWTELNEHAWNFYLYVEDEGKLGKALEWAESASDIDQNFYTLNTMAHLYFKLGKMRQAKSVARAAIEIAKETGDDYSAAELLLEN